MNTRNYFLFHQEQAQLAIFHLLCRVGDTGNDQGAQMLIHKKALFMSGMILSLTNCLNTNDSSDDTDAPIAQIFHP